ncbi:MAG: trypsin-like peptidase domain-containing protein [Synechococcus sp.]
MLKLSNEDRGKLLEAILSAYPNPEDLETFVNLELDRNIHVVAGSGNHRTVAFKLIQWAIAKGYIDDLILALQRDIPNRPDIQHFCGQVLHQRLNLNVFDVPLEGLQLKLEASAWDIDIRSEELERFLPKRFSFEADVGELLRGLKLANSVCKITFADRSPDESGTGVLIAPNLVLTNYHVLSLERDADLNEVARVCRFEFGYVSPKFGEFRRTQTLNADVDTPVIVASPIDKLDYALIRLGGGADVAIDPVPLNHSTELGKNSPLNILQHPEGEQMKVSLSNNGVIKTNKARGLVLYVNPTKQGSSGSPCFNENWELVALHHKGLATPFGSIREGILFSAIYPEISFVL